MGKGLIRAAAMGSAFALIVAAAAFAEPHVIRAGNLFLRDNGGISPSKLPKHEQAPISAHINAEIGTIDGSHPPAVKTLIIDFDRNFQVNARGLPICRYDQLTNRPTAAAEQACPQAIVGSGEGEVEVAFPDAQPFTGKGRVVFFNGGVHGGTTLLLVHAYLAIPAPTAVVVAVKITRIHSGHYGIHTVTQIPALAAGDGSVTKFKLKLSHKFTYKGKKESYLTASCPTGHYYAEGTILFADGPTLKGTHIMPCTPKG